MGIMGAFQCLLTRPWPRCYLIAPMVSRAIRARALICFFRANPSAVNSPCLRAFRLPLGARHRPRASDKPHGPARPELGSVARSASIWRGIATPGAYPSAWG